MSYLSLGDKNEEEGDFFGSPVSSGGQSSRLGSLFGMNAKMDRDPSSNQSLTYTAPKPPKSERNVIETGDKKTVQQTQVSPGVAVAAAVTAFRYVNNQYKKQGKLGAALLSNFAEKDYKILMYISKQQPVSTAKITPEFQFNIQPNNYASFYDDQRQMWSILFDSTEHLVNFAKQVCLAKYNCNQNIDNVIMQDLELGEQDAQPLATGDSVETVYTGWLVQQQTGTLGAIFDSNHKTDKTFRFKTGKGKVIKGWEQGMLGLRKGGKRFLIIPPSLAYGSKGAGNRVPANSCLAFEVDILRVKHQNAESSSMQGPNSAESLPATSNQPEPSFGTSLDVPFAGMPAPTNVGDETVKGRTASFNEQISHANTEADINKAKLLSRMAKMGKPMLPTQQQPNAVLQSQVETEQHRPMVVASSPIAPVSHTPPQGNIQINREISHSPAYSNSPVQMVEHQPYMHNPHAVYQQQAVHPGHAISPNATLGMLQNNAAVAQYQPTAGLMQYAGIHHSNFNPMQQYAMPTPSGTDILPAILVESQKQSSELKLLMEKMDKVSNNVSELKKSSEHHQHGSISSSMESMDAALLSHNIQRIIQENEKMKTKMLEKNKQIESQNDKLTDLLQQNQKLVEESHAQMEKRNVSFKQTFGQSQERTLQLEQEKVELTNKLSDATSKICELQLNLANVTEKSRSLEKIARESSNADISKVQEMASDLSVLKKQLEEERNMKQQLEKSFHEKILSSDNELEKKLEAVQREFEAEKSKLMKEIANLKQSYQADVDVLREKSTSDSSNAGEIKQELEKRWKEKCREAVATVTKAAEEKIEEVNNERQELSYKIDTFQNKFLQLRGMYEEKLKSEEELTEQLEDFENIKDRYDNLRKQAVAMKEKYEETINDLRENQSSNTSSTTDVTDQIKSVMNEVFQQVRSEISPIEEYSGKDVLAIILNIVKSTTMKLLRTDESQEEQSEEENNAEEEEEEETDEDVQSEGEVEISEEPITTTIGVDDTTASSSYRDNIGAEDSEPVQETEMIPTPLSSPANDDCEENQIDVEDSKVHSEPTSSDNANVSESTSTLLENTIMQADESVFDDKLANVESNEINDIEERRENNEEVDDPEKKVDRTISPFSDGKPSPPPLFDDDDDENDDKDLDWLG